MWAPPACEVASAAWATGSSTALEDPQPLAQTASAIAAASAAVRLTPAWTRILCSPSTPRPPCFSAARSPRRRRCRLRGIDAKAPLVAAIELGPLARHPVDVVAAPGRRTVEHACQPLPRHGLAGLRRPDRTSITPFPRDG